MRRFRMSGRKFIGLPSPAPHFSRPSRGGLSTASRQLMEKRLRAVMDEQKDGIKLFPLCEACVDKKSGLGNFSGWEETSPWIIL